MIPVVPYASRNEQISRILDRRATFSNEIDQVVAEVLQQVRSRGDAALHEYTLAFDKVQLRRFLVSKDLLQHALDAMDPALRAIVETAEANIRTFHEHQLQNSWFVEGDQGVMLGQRVVPMQKAGIYVPGGTAAYPSSVLMNVVPAQVAGVPEIHMVSPPGPDGLPHPLVMATAALLGIENLYAIGGAQAIAALAFGTETFPRVDVITGPGNAYVAAAKRMVYGQVAIDSVAGPSEIVVLADDTAQATHVGADLLSQAEHDERASAILVTPSLALAEAVQRYVAATVPTLSRNAILESSLSSYGACIVTPGMTEAIDMVNELAPEHLEIITVDPWKTLQQIKHAGAIFLGPYSSEPVGDYFAGPNHVLPTGGTARFASALSVDNFIRKQSLIAYSKEALDTHGPAISTFARAEGLDAHARAIEERL